MMKDGRTQRELLEAMRVEMRNERSTFDSHWRDLSDYILPRRTRFFTSDRNKGDKRNQKIIDGTATLAARTLSSGMMSGITSPARPWFRLTTPDPDMAEFWSVKEWLDQVTRRMRDVMAQSNFYRALPTMYGDMGVFGTAAVMLLEDSDDVIRTANLPLGSYYAATNDRGHVDTFCREYQMTVRQIASAFGVESMSKTLRGMWEKGQYGEWVDVVHFVMPNEQWQQGKLIGKQSKRFKSCYYEAKSNDGEYLRESGFDDFPVLVPRWEVSGEDIYGTNCPGMSSLADIRALQVYEKRSAQAVEKMISPPMTAPTSLQNKKFSLLPGDVTFLDVAQGQQGFRPAHEVSFSIDKVELKSDQIRQRISRSFYEDLFLMLAQSDRREITAREIDERHEEKLLMLGPVLEQINDDVLDPVIDRVFNIMMRGGLLPPAPKELSGMSLRVEYVSIMAQAQKLVATAGIERFVQFTGQVAAVSGNPAVMDKVDIDQTIDEYGEMLGVPARIIRSDEDVAVIRQDRNEQAQAAQQAALAQQQAATAKSLSQTNVTDDNALTRLSKAMAGGV